MGDGSSCKGRRKRWVTKAGCKGRAFEGGKIFERGTRHSHPREKGPRPPFLSLAPKKMILSPARRRFNSLAPPVYLSQGHQLKTTAIVANLPELLPVLFRHQ